MAEPSVTLACRNYDETNALIRRRLGIAGMNLRVDEVNDGPKMFSGMMNGEYDVSEMSLAELVYYLTRDRCDFVGSRCFHRDCFGIVSSSATAPPGFPARKI